MTPYTATSLKYRALSPLKLVCRSTGKHIFFRSDMHIFCCVVRSMCYLNYKYNKSNVNVYSPTKNFFLWKSPNTIKPINTISQRKRKINQTTAKLQNQNQNFPARSI